MTVWHKMAGALDRQPGRDYRFLRMSLRRRLLVLLVALAVIVSGAGGIAAPFAADADPCMQEHGNGHGDAGRKAPPAPHKKETRTCQQCCLGICVSVPDVPIALTIAPVSITLIAYFDTARFGVGRSIKPDHGPPRLLA